MPSTKIEWTDATWNPITGCSKISPGCEFCYAERMSKRLQAMGSLNYKNSFKVTCHRDSLSIPAKWRKPKMVFVASMSDLFHEKVPICFINDVFQIMNTESRHCFQVLTKRSERLAELAAKLSWTGNIWAGVSIENDQYQYRIDDLRKVPAKIRFLSIEPLLGPLPQLNLEGIDWVIVGGESGPGAREMRHEWVIDIRNQCIELSIPFFFKQWGGVNKKKAGRSLENHIWDEMPESDLSRKGPK